MEVLHFFTKLDLQLLLSLNSLMTGTPVLDKLLSSFGNNNLVRGLPIFLPLIILWAERDDAERRARMFVGCAATCLALFVSLYSQHHFDVHMRPLLDPNLPIHVYNEKLLKEDWDRIWSFPSDTATLYFGLSTIVFIESRRLGILAYLWSLLVAGVVRVFIGYHYPSDILAAIVLGAGAVALLEAEPLLVNMVKRVQAAFPMLLYAGFFIFISEAYDLFPGLQSALRGVALIVRGAPG